MQKPILTLGGVLWRSHGGMSLPVMAGLILVLGLARPTQATEFACGAGDVACLIAAINTANANGQANTITLEAGTYTLMVVNNTTGGPNGLPVITSPLTMRGAGAEASSIERATSAPPFRLVFVAATGTLVLEGLTLKNGVSFLGGGIQNSGTLTITLSTLSGNSASQGGGIYNFGTMTIAHSTLSGNSASQGGGPAGGGGISNEGTVTIAHSTLSGNSAHSDTPNANGGAILNSGLPTGGTVTITHSTLSGNSVSGGMSSSGGGINNLESCVLTITNSTLSDNSASGNNSGGGGISNISILTITNSTLSDNSASQGGGIRSLGRAPLVTLQNTILAHNTVPPTGTSPDCGGPVTSLDYNLIGDPTDCLITLLPSDLIGDPGLNDFTDDGTPGRGYFPLLPDSPAIDAGNDAVCPQTDQLGQPRVGRCDIGAIEFQPPGVDVVAIRQAIFADKLALLFVVATSSAVPDAELFVTVPECLMQAPMLRIGDRYVMLRGVHTCGNLDGQTATVTSSRGGMAGVSLR